jgi:hypothetical protein
VLLTKTWPTYKKLTAVNHSLSLVALHVSPTCWAPTISVLTPLLTAVQRRTSVRRSTGATSRNSKACRSPSHYACGSWRRSYSSFLVIVLCLDLRVHASKCNKEYCNSLTLVRFYYCNGITLFCLSSVCNLILTHIWDAFGFPRKIRCDNATRQQEGTFFRK